MAMMWPILQRQFEARNRRRFDGVVRQAAALRHGADARRRSEPYGRASHENRCVDGRTRKRTSLAYASHFDINWHPATTKATSCQENKVLLPVLAILRKCPGKQAAGITGR